MRRLTLILLSAAAIGAATQAARETIARLPQATIAQGERLFPSLGARLGDVVELTIQHGPTPLRLIKGAHGWTAPSKFDYPAKTELVNQLLATLSEMETVEAKTGRADLQQRLDLGDPALADAKSTALTVKGAGGTALAELVWGKRRSAGGAYAPGTRPMYYVRKPGAERALLVQASAPFELKTAAIDWLNKDVLDFRATRVTKITFIDPSGMDPNSKPLVLTKDKPEDADFKLAEIPEGYQPKEKYELNLPAALIDLLAFDDVQPAAKLPGDAKLLRTVVFELTGGLTLTITHVEAEGGPWTRITAGGSPDSETGKAELAKLVAATAPWVYRLPEFKQKRIMTTRDDLMAKPAG